MKTLGQAIRDYLRWLRHRGFVLLQRHTFITFLFAFVLVVSGTSFLFQFIEHDHSSSLWRSVIYFMSGMDVDPPQTTGGQVLAILILICGVVFVSVLTGYIASEFSRLLLRAQAIPRKPEHRVFNNHIIIFGWGAKTRAILRQLNSNYEQHAFRADDIVIVSPETILEKGEERIYEKTWHVHGNATETETLERTNLRSGNGTGARVAAILAEGGVNRDEADRQSLLTLLAVENMYPDVISLTEVLEGESRVHFANAFADETIVPSDYGTLLLARTSEFPGTASYMDELLALGSNAEGKEPISLWVRSAADLKVEGKALEDAVAECYCRNKGLIAGLLTRTQVQLLPDILQVGNRILTPTDQLVVIARPAEVGE